MFQGLLSEQLTEMQLADRRREAAALQRGILAARISRQARREAHRAVRARTGKVPAPAASAGC
jgi:hypothetical protein